MVQLRQMMDPGHPEQNLWGIASLAMAAEMSETWQHALDHWLDVVLAFSGLSLGLGYGVLLLALPLLLLPIAFPELSRPRDALWSLLLAALAPLLLLNRLPVFSSAGLGELFAAVLMARLAAEVGQGRWESLTPHQREALRHLPRWRSAGADLVAAVLRAAEATWNAVVQVGKAVRGGGQDGGASSGIPEVTPATEPNPGPAADDGGDGGQQAEGAQASGEDGATGGSGEATPEQAHRAGTGWIAAVVQAPQAAWGAVFGPKGTVQQGRQGQSTRKPARKAWVRPDPSVGAQDGQDGQDGGTSPAILDVAPATEVSPDLAVDNAPGSNAPGAETPQPVKGGDGGQEAENTKVSLEETTTGAGEDAAPEQEHLDKPAADGSVTASAEDATPEEHSAPQPAEEPQQAQPGGLAEAPEPAAQPAERDADAVGAKLEDKESVAEDPGAPEPVELSGGAQPAQPLDGDEAEDAEADMEAAATGAGEDEDITPEQGRPDKPAADGSVTDMAEDAAPQEHSAPQPVEEPQQAQPVDGGDLEDGKGADAAPEAPEAVERPVEPPESEPQPSQGIGAHAAGPAPDPGESAPEEPSTPEFAEGAQLTQPLHGAGQPKAGPTNSPSRDADNDASVAVALDDDPEHGAAADQSGGGFVAFGVPTFHDYHGQAAADESGEGFAAKADPGADTPQAMTDASEAEAGPAQPAGEDVVVGSFDEVDAELRGTN